MKVIFLQDVTNVASAGDIKDVTDGYARNYLIPRKLAVPASPSAEATAEVQKKIRARQEAKTMEQLRDLANQIQGKEIIVRAKAGAKGKLFGSVTGADIADALQKAIGREIDKRKVELAEPIKQTGTYEVEIKLAKDINPKIKVSVEAEEEEKEKTARAETAEKPAEPEAKQETDQSAE